MALQNNIVSIGKRIKDFVTERIEKYRYTNFKNQLNRNEIFIRYNYNFKPSITLPIHTN